MPPAVARVNLDAVDPQVEIVVRAGTVRPSDPTIDVVHILMTNYGAADEQCPGVYGLSVLYHEGFDLDMLARRNPLRHKQLSYGTVEALRTALRQVGYEMVLLVTPNADLPDHHSLAVALAGQPELEQAMPEPVAETLVWILTVMENPHRKMS